MSASAPEKRVSTWICIVLFVATLLLYAPARNFDYISLDDPAYVDPPQVKGGLTWEGFRWAFTTGHAANWHPLTWLSHMADASLFGDKPAGGHIVNALLHAVNAALAFLLLRALTGQVAASAVVAALFAFHPLRVESVAWVAERKDLLSGFFFLLTLAGYARYARTGKARDYATVAVLFALGLLAKPMLVTLPFVLLLLDVWPLSGKRRWGWLIVEKLPLFALAAGSSVVTFFVQGASGAMRGEAVYPLGLRTQNAIVSCGAYLWKTIWPAKLAVFYPYEGALPGTTIAIATVLLSAVTLIVITAGALLIWRRNRAVLIGWLWFLGMLVPVIGLVQVGLQARADRYTYLPHIGLFVAITFGAAQFISQRTLVIVAAPLVIALAIVTRVQLRHWTDTITLFTHAIAVTDKNHLAHNNLGYTYMRDGRFPDAIRHFEHVIAINPSNAEPYYNIGLAYDEMGNRDQARAWFEKALQRDPNYVDAHINLGNVLLAQKDLERAIAHYRRAVELAPESFLPQYNLALALSQRDGDLAALTQFERAVRLNLQHAEARYSYAMALRAAGETGGAIEQFAEAAKLAQAQGLTDLLAEIQRQQNPANALPKPATKPENP